MSDKKGHLAKISIETHIPIGRHFATQVGYIHRRLRDEYERNAANLSMLGDKHKQRPAGGWGESHDPS